MTKKNWKADWPKPKTVFSNRLHDILPNQGMSKIAQNYFLGASKNTVFRYLSGDSEPSVSEVLRVAEVTGCDIDWLLTGKNVAAFVDEKNGQAIQTEDAKMDEEQRRRGLDAINSPASVPESAYADPLDSMMQESRKKPTPINRLPKGNAIRRKGDQDAAHKIIHLKTVGSAAALVKGAGHRGGFDDESLYWDSVQEIPESTHLIKIRGDSMEPLMMHGQSVMVGTQYRLDQGEVPRPREIVVAQVLVQNTDIGDMDSQWEGVHCKRVQDEGDFWLFTSINPSGESFTVSKDNCYLWHVIGTYYGEKGAIPHED